MLFSICILPLTEQITKLSHRLPTSIQHGFTQVCQSAADLNEIFTSLDESIDLCKDAVLIEHPAEWRELVMNLGRLHNTQLHTQT